MIAGGQYGFYCLFDGTSPSFHQHMRHKALVPTETINVSVSSGWNTIGIPYAAYRLFKSQVYPTAVGNVYKYDGGYVAADPLANNRGYWANFSSPQSISYTGAKINYMRMVVKPGWNIIGSISSTIATSTVTSDPPSIITSSIYKWQNGYVPTTTIEPGGGYWVTVNQNGRIILQTGGLNKLDGEDFETYDRFTVTDNDGNQQNLYVRNSIIVGTTASLEMPPAPPDPEFDTRFSSNDIVRTVNPENGTIDLSIDINAAVYPITLTWEINPANGISYSFDGGSLGKISSSGNLLLSNNTENTIKLFGKSNKSVSDIPNSFMLYQNFPNPFNPQTTIQYDVKEKGLVQLYVYDILGNKVAELVNEVKEEGTHFLSFDASNLPSGTYFYKIQVNDYVSSKKMMLVK